MLHPASVFYFTYIETSNQNYLAEKAATGVNSLNPS